MLSSIFASLFADVPAPTQGDVAPEPLISTPFIVIAAVVVVIVAAAAVLLVIVSRKNRKKCNGKEA